MGCLRFIQTKTMNTNNSTATHTTGSSKCPTVLSVPTFIEDSARKIQLTPTIPEEVRDLNKITSCIAVVQPGRHGSEWIRVRDNGGSSEGNSQSGSIMDVNTLSSLINEASSKKNGAVYVGLPQILLGNINSTRGRDCLNLLLQNEFEFHNFDIETKELIYRKWVRENTPNLVPPYATSIEGGGCLVLSPGGAVDPGESSIETALREVVEETHVELDLERENSVRIGVSYHQPRSRDGRVNDNFVLFVVYAKERRQSKDINIDENELTGARWFSIEKLVDEFRKRIYDKGYEEAGKTNELGQFPASTLGPHCEKGSFTEQVFGVPSRMQILISEKLETVGGMELFCLDKLLRGECSPFRLHDNGKN